MPLIESIPNISEGRRAVVQPIADELASLPGVRLLDLHSDATHNRSVFTLAGEAAPLAGAILRLYQRAIEVIDLREQRGEHPRLGAVDVCPFVPLEDATMADCVELAKTVAAAVAARFGIPVYLYEEAAASPARRHLENIRRGGFEGLPVKMQEEAWAPDFGPRQPHVSAGATVIGARRPLIAYNINLATDRLDIAREIARTVRASNGGLPFVKALGIPLPDRGIVQVSMNLTNHVETPVHRVFEAVRREAAQRGVEILESEIVGLIPAAALEDAAAHFLKVAGFHRAQILEQQLRAGS